MNNESKIARAAALAAELEAEGFTSEHLDEAVHQAASELASATNNAGLVAQVEFLLARGDWQPDDIRFRANESRESDDFSEVEHGDAYDPRLARVEGWDLFDSDVRGLEIQRDDEAAIFANDEAAVTFVRRRANAGSIYHQKALAIHDNNPHHKNTTT